MTVQTDRDPVTEIRALVEAATQGWGVAPGVVAAKLIAQLEERDHELLHAWLHAMAVPLLTNQITLWERNRRAASRRHAQARDFREAVESGDPDALSMFTTTFAVDEENTRLRVADMRGPHHEFVASGYAASGAKDLLEAEFHRQVAKKIRSRTTAEVFTEEQYVRMYRSIAGD